MAEKKAAELVENKKPAAAPKVKAAPTPKVKEVKPEDFDDGKFRNSSRFIMNFFISFQFSGEWVQAVNKKDRKQRRSEAQTPEGVFVW